MLEFFIESMLFYLLEHAYVCLHLYFLFRRKHFFFVALPLFLCMGFFPLVFLLLPEGSGVQKLFSLFGTFWLPGVFFLFLAFLAGDLMNVLNRLARKHLPRLHFPAPRGAWWAVFLFFCALAYGYGLYEARSLQVTRLSIPVEELPEGYKAFRIIFASDMHINPHTGIRMLQNSVDAIMEQKPDLILLGGDILDDGLQGTQEDLDALRRLKSPFGVYGVLGNHDARVDAARAGEFLSRAGIRMLAEEMAVTGPVTIIGMDDPTVYEEKGGDDQDGEFLKLVKKSKAEHPKNLLLILEHKPIVRKEYIGLYDLQVSGHTHGGQIFLISPHVHAKYGVKPGLNRFSGQAGNSLFYVSNGTGFSKLPIRLLAPPEILVIDLMFSPQVRSEAPQ